MLPTLLTSKLLSHRVLAALLIGIVLTPPAFGQAHDDEEDHAGHGHEEHGHEDEHEGPLHIDAEMAERSGLATAQAGPATLRETVTVFGKTALDPQHLSHLRGRFPGLITAVQVKVGDTVQAGDVLAEVESNQSLRSYRITAPFGGVITEQRANIGEVVGEEPLFTLANFQQLWAELQVFPGQAQRIEPGQAVRLSANGGHIDTQIEHYFPSPQTAPYRLARAPIDNSGGEWAPGLWLQAEVAVDSYQVDLAVDNQALQSVDGETVVFVQEGDTFEARPLRLGRSDGRFSEVLGGLQAGERYVHRNSYLLKAELEKSGAAHHH